MKLAEQDAAATVAVKDINVARKFYEGILGLQVSNTQQRGVVEYKSGGSKVLVYESQFAGTNQATAVTWNVADIEKLASELKGKGVAFEHYDFPGATLKGDVHVMGNIKAAWFKDPDGNILALVGS
jgi:catechol-2,3-dioxygenase